MSRFRTAESVSPKHPDKLCDQISDAILDAYLAEDATARVAVETVGGHGSVFITGEVTAKNHIDVQPIVQRIAGDVELIVHLVKQSPEIAQGVDTGGAGDQARIRVAGHRDLRRRGIRQGRRRREARRRDLHGRARRHRARAIAAARAARSARRGTRARRR